MDAAAARLRELFQRMFNGTLTEEERQELRALAAAPDLDALLPDMLQQQWEQLEPGDEFSPGQRRQLSQRILAQYPAEPVARVRSFWPRIAAAAAVVAILFAGVYGWRQQAAHPAKEKQVVEVLPGKQGAILTLADNTQVLLDTVKNGVVTLQGGARAVVVNGSLVYENNGDEVVYHTMSTPRGRQFHVTLPDGTDVWLNAASSIRYPTAFKDNQRQVEITGEAYLEVAASAQQPFLVNVDNKTTVQVLGTRFNVNAYADESNITTTLLDGKVRVAGATLQPGQQALLGNRERKVSIVEKADLDKTMAWKNGLFNFEDASLQQVMRQLERWYDIEVVYQDEVPELYFIGEISRDVPLTDVLSFLQTTGVRFRLQGRVLTVLN